MLAALFETPLHAQRFQTALFAKGFKVASQQVVGIFLCDGFAVINASGCDAHAIIALQRYARLARRDRASSVGEGAKSDKNGAYEILVQRFHGSFGSLLFVISSKDTPMLEQISAK